MKTVKILVSLFVLLGFTNCSKKTPNTEKIQKQNNQNVSETKQLQNDSFTLYKKLDHSVRVARMQKSDNNFNLYLFEINTKTPENAKQILVSSEAISRDKINSTKNELKKDYDWTPFKGQEFLFIQIQPKGFKDEFELMNRQEIIELQITNALNNRKLGEWSASDIGPGGANLLYSVKEIDASLGAVLEVLKQNNIQKNVLIGKRVLFSNEDWFYEIIYPEKYSGNFNTM